jgi:hypothetical protein
MKFETYLESSTLLEWRKEYIDYRGLSKIVTKIQHTNDYNDNPPGRRAARERFQKSRDRGEEGDYPTGRSVRKGEVPIGKAGEEERIEERGRASIQVEEKGAGSAGWMGSVAGSTLQAEGEPSSLPLFVVAVGRLTFSPSFVPSSASSEHGRTTSFSPLSPGPSLTPPMAERAGVCRQAGSRAEEGGKVSWLPSLVSAVAHAFLCKVVLTLLHCSFYKAREDELCQRVHVLHEQAKELTRHLQILRVRGLPRCSPFSSDRNMLMLGLQLSPVANLLLLYPSPHTLSSDRRPYQYPPSCDRIPPLNSRRSPPPSPRP